MHLKFDWLVVLENLRRGILVTDANLDPPDGPRIIYANRAWLAMTGYTRDEITDKTPRILQGKHTDHAVLDDLKRKLRNREIFHGQTWNYRKNGQPFLMNWYTYAVYGERPTPIYYVAEQENVTEMEKLRFSMRLMHNPADEEALRFFAVLEEWEGKQELQPAGETS